MDRGGIIVVQHIDCEGLGGFEPVLKSSGFKPVFVNGGKGERIPDSMDGFEALILLGGPIGVYEADRYPFLKDEVKLIQASFKEDKPVLGICLGAQLIAEALGGKVYKGGKKEIGWYRIYLTGEGRRDPLFKGIPDSPFVFQWHGDTFELPDGAERLAFSYIYPNQAFRVGRKIYALQFHLEVTEEMVCKWMKEYEGELEGEEAIRPEIIYKDTRRYIKDLMGYSEGFFRGFIGLI